MKKTIIFLSLLALTLAGCNGKNKDTSPAFSQAPQSTTAISLPKTENTTTHNSTPLSVFIGYDSQYISEYGGGNKHYAYWEQLVLDEDTKAKHPALVKSIDQYNNKIKAIGTEYATKTLPDYLKDFPSDYSVPLSCSLNMSVQRADDKVLSLLTKEDSYLGGPHPNCAYTSANFDVQSGKLLTIDDIVADKQAFGDLVIQKIKSKYPDGLYDDWQTILRQNISQNKLTWVMESNRLVLWFSPYELAPYVVGTLTIPIEYHNSVKESYQSALKSSVTPLPFYQSTEIGKDSITVTPNKNEHQIYESMDITFNGKSLHLADCYTYQPSAYLVSFVSGKKYIYVHTLSEDGIQQLIICDLNSSSLFEATPRLMYTGFRIENSNTKNELKEVFVNADSFILTKQTPDSVTEYYKAHVDENTGIPVTDEKIK